MSCNSSMYEAVRSRGYMLELDDCPNVQALAEEMYPVLRDAMTYNAHVVAVPVRVTCGDIAVNVKALELLGLTVDDVPTSWEGMLDFLDKLAEDWDEDSDVTIAAEFASEQQARSTILLFMLIACQRYANVSDTPMSYDSELLRGLIDHLYKIDFEALGCEHLEDENSYVWPDENKEPLFTFSARSAALGSWNTGMLPLLLSIEEGGESYMVMDCAVAFVNPFTKNPEAALEYMDLLAQDLVPQARYNLVPTLDEPVRNTSVDAKIAELETKRQKREAAPEDAEAADTQEIEDEIESLKADIEARQKRVWSISEDQIEWFRAHDDNMRMGGVNWLLSSDGGEAFDLLSQFLRDQISMNELLSGIDQKIQMRMEEGN